ncbi:4868_t:CDS:2 [Entrophospora sp. SA101]|nr:4868_t:CDS:2 [Entrophospora sp. SA101]
MADNTIHVLLKTMKIVIYYQDIDVVLGASLTNAINSTSSLKSMSQITNYSLEPDLVVLLRTNIEFETDNKIEEAKKRMDLDVIMDDKDDMDNLQSRKKKRTYLL